MANTYYSKYAGEEIDNAVAQTGVNSSRLEVVETKLNDISGSAISHNGIYRGKNLTGVYTVEEMYQKITSGTFEDLYLGDYFTFSTNVNLPGGAVSAETVSLVFAGFDYYYNVGDQVLAKHHAVMIPYKPFSTMAKFNETSSVEGGYLNSYIHQTVLPCYASAMSTALEGHLLTYRDWLTSSVGGDYATGCTWADVTLQLMNEVQLYGTVVWGKSQYEIGCGNRQLPLFKFISPVTYTRNRFWLRTIAKTDSASASNHYGHAYIQMVSLTSAVRPIMLFG